MASSILSFSEIQEVLNGLTLLYSQHPGFISVTFTESGVFDVRLTQGALNALGGNASQEVDVLVGGVPLTVQVQLMEGVRIVPVLGDIRLHPPASVEALDGEMGGDQCRNARDMNYYGTIGFYAGSMEWNSRGTCTIDCITRPALVSNNHVIALSDRAKAGDKIWTPFRQEVAELHCWVPLHCSSTSDIAFGRLLNWSGIRSCRIRTIGAIPMRFRLPVLGEAIHKHGARTQYTTGKVTGRSNIQVGGRTYQGVYATTGGFGCAGDSGSAVIAKNSTNEPLGLFTWGEDKPCEKDPIGYFFAFPPSESVIVEGEDGEQYAFSALANFEE